MYRLSNKLNQSINKQHHRQIVNSKKRFCSSNSFLHSFSVSNYTFFRDRNLMYSDYTLLVSHVHCSDSGDYYIIDLFCCVVVVVVETNLQQSTIKVIYIYLCEMNECVLKSDRIFFGEIVANGNARMKIKEALFEHCSDRLWHSQTALYTSIRIANEIYFFH